MERHYDGRRVHGVFRLADPPRNGLPRAKPYEWNPGEAERQAEVAARLAAIRAQVRESRARRGRLSRGAARPDTRLPADRAGRR